MNNTTKGALVAIIFILPLSIGLYYNVMQYVMGVLLILISLLKLIELKQFSAGFRKYDLLAKKSSTYATLYPFLELIAGISLLFVTTQVLLLQSILGVLLIAFSITLFSTFFVKEEQVCGCLGIVSRKLNIPLTLFTKIENIIMITMLVILLLTIS